jgi:D-beta-D-heptose 7-phosphate kinase/D-beta-D-heptose 1-phosphate adenosyltransferase
MTDSKNTPALKKFKILLIGDSCEDEYYIGSCDRLSPEAPVPVLKIQEHFTAPGMAANVKKNLQVLEQRVDFLTNTGTIKKIRYIDRRSGQHLLRVDDESNKIIPWDKNLPILFLGGRKDTYDFYDAVVISDYNKGFLSYEHIVFIDTKKRDLKRFEGAIIKINLHEFNQLTSTPDNMKGLIVTNGENGAMYNSVHYPAKKVEVSDVCGAGDTFLAYLTYGYLTSAGDIPHAIKLSIQAASETVKHRGNYAPKLEEIELDA